jgi:hypothetical protein
MKAPARRRVRARGLGVVLALAGALAAGSAAAQPGGVAAVPVQGLSFGPLIPGVPEVVSVDDAARRAEVVLEGKGSVDVLLVLPRAMVSRAGGSIPLHFGASDAALASTGSERIAPMDPLRSMRVNLAGGSAPPRLLLGGTATAGRAQPAGEYSTTIVVIISKAGT